MSNCGNASRPSCGRTTNRIPSLIDRWSVPPIGVRRTSANPTDDATGHAPHHSTFGSILEPDDEYGRGMERSSRPIRSRSRKGPAIGLALTSLLEKIGEGGMGDVYMAEQEKPVRRRVALKIIKPGMDSDQVVARFEAERQALALMDHQNIARVLDVGTTNTGRPFFVMELVHGLAITEYCDRSQLTTKERLELFIPVCQAIQHAHQNGIIHRDIKPSNVLVTLYDGKPVAKVIDFGVAKAIEQRLTERTLFTQYGLIVGTFEYMSPEQAEMSALGVRHAQRHLLARSALVRTADRHDPVRTPEARRVGLRGHPPTHPRRGASQAQHSLEGGQGFAFRDLGPAQDGSCPPDEPDEGRARLDRDEGDSRRIGPGAIESANASRPRRPSVSRRGRGGSLPAVGRVPPAEIREEESRDPVHGRRKHVRS